MSGPHDESNEFGLVSRTLGGLPIVNQMLDRLGLPALLAGALPDHDARLKLAPAVAIRLVVTNLVLGREPLYGLGEWPAVTTRRCSGCARATSGCSTTTGSGGHCRRCSTPTGPAC